MGMGNVPPPPCALSWTLVTDPIIQPRRHGQASPGAYVSQDSDERARWFGSLSGPKRAVLFVSVGVLVVNLVTFGTLLGLGALPFQFDPGTEAAAAAPTTVVGAQTPAGQAVGATIATEVAGFSAPAPTEVGAGTFPVYPCSLSPQTQPVFGRYRTFSSAERTVAVTASAYGPGAGPWVMEGLAAQLSQCAEQRADVAAAQGVDGIGVQAVAAGVPQGSVMLVRRGDIILTLVGPAADAEKVARGLDAELTNALSDCVDPVGTLGDETRNPWLPGVEYKGMFVDSEVQVPALGAPSPPQGIEAVALDAAPITLPAVYRPTRPADPVWPLSLPVEVAAPTAPVSPGPEPTRTVIKVPQVDRLGPGCGWAFTNSAAPAVDETELNEQREALRAAATEELKTKQAAWQPAVTAYYQQWADYSLRVLAFGDYAKQVSSVAAAWQKITDDRNLYALALRNYDDAVAAREAFLADKQAAADEYQRQLLVCAAPEPTPSPTPTQSPQPSPSPSGSAGPSTAPSPAPSASAPEEPRPRPGCPPARPAILDQDPPSVPAPPTPPADPRPPQYRN